MAWAAVVAGGAGLASPEEAADGVFGADMVTEHPESSLHMRAVTHPPYYIFLLRASNF